MSRTIARPLLVIGIIAAVSASWLHLVAWMARYESPGQWWVAALAAVAVDIGLLASLRTAGEMAAAGRSTRDAMIVVVALVLVSFAANVQHALAMQPGDVVNAIAVAGVLPLVALGLSHLYDVSSRAPVPEPAQAATASPTVALQVNTLVDARPRRLTKRERMVELAAMTDPSLGVPGLAAEWGVSEATIYRDLQELREVTHAGG